MRFELSGALCADGRCSNSPMGNCCASSGGVDPPHASRRQRLHGRDAAPSVGVRRGTSARMARYTSATFSALDDSKRAPSGARSSDAGTTQAHEITPELGPPIPNMSWSGRGHVPGQGGGQDGNAPGGRTTPPRVRAVHLPRPCSQHPHRAAPGPASHPHC